MCVFIVDLSTIQSESYSTRSATRSGVQALESPVEVKRGKVPKTTQYEFGGPIGKLEKEWRVILSLPTGNSEDNFSCGHLKNL